MSSRDLKANTDELDALLRYALRSSVANRAPSPDARRRLMARVVAHQRPRLRGLAAVAAQAPPEVHPPVWDDGSWYHLVTFNFLRNFGFVGAPHYQIR